MLRTQLLTAVVPHCGAGESHDAYLSIPGGQRLFGVSVFPESGQQEEAADALRPRLQPTLWFRAQEIRHRGRPEDIRLRCRFYPGCLASKNSRALYVCLCGHVCVVGEFGFPGAKGCVDAKRVWPRLRGEMCVSGQGPF